MAMLTDTFTDALKSVLITPLQHWLSDHPMIGWLVMHPLWALAMVGVAIVLLAGLWSAIARLTEGFWLTLVRLPFHLGGWLLTTVSGLLLQHWAKPTKPAASPDRLNEILHRLETLQTEQAGLLAEMQQLLTERQ